MVPAPFVISDPKTLRALGNPLRQQLIRTIGALRHARAVDLAPHVGQPANALSFHLRALADAGLIVEAPELARDRRDRVWRLAHPEGMDLDPASPAGAAIFGEQLEWIRGQFLDRDPSVDDAHIYTADILLGTGDAQRLFDELGAVLDRWRERPADGEDAVMTRAVLVIGAGERSSAA